MVDNALTLGQDPIEVMRLEAGSTPGRAGSGFLVVGVDPPSAHKGDVVRISGAHFPTNPAVVRVLFGLVAVRPLAVSADGTTIEAEVPDLGEATRSAPVQVRADDRLHPAVAFQYAGAGQ